MTAAAQPKPNGNQPKAFSVSGQIRHADGRPFARANVRAFDKDLRSEELLGEATSDQDGRYAIQYTAKQLRRAGKKSADLIVRVFDQNGSVLAASPVVFNAQPVETVDLSVAAKEPTQPSEYEALLSNLLPVLQGVPPKGLSEDDIRYLHGATGQDALRLVFLVLAHRYASKTAIPPEVFYGLFRQNLPTRLAALLLQKPSALRSALETSVQQNVIPAALGGQIETILAALAQPSALVNAGENETIPALEILKATSLLPEQRAKFLRAFARHEGAVENFWQALREDKEFSAAQIKELQLTLQLGVLTRNHAPVIREIVKRKPLAEMNSLRDLAGMQESDWLHLIRQPGVGVPPDGPGSPEPVLSLDITIARGDDAPSKAYAHSITQLVAAAFPTAVVASDMSRADRPENRDAIQFFRNCPDFEFENTRIDDYLASNAGQAYAGVSDQAALSQQLKSMQRVYHVAPRYAHLRTLLDAGLDSAYAISGLPQSSFVEQFGTQLGGNAQATAYYAQARKVSDAAASVFVNVAQSVNDVSPMVIGKKSPDIKQMPSFTTLFGSATLCDCEDCQSVYGPAAYLVDLLQLINPPTGEQAIRQLRKRRPDIEHLQLTCDNTNVELPYIDVVNEIMEFYIGSGGQLHQLPAYNTSDITSDELSVNPQHTNDQAYQLLQAAVYPPTLPFSRPVAMARAYLEHLGSSRYEVMQTFAKDAEAATLRASDAESLKIAPEEYRTLSGKNFDDTDVTPAPTVVELYGYSNPAFPILEKGSKGRAVRVLQELLKSVGGSPDLKVTGDFGNDTEDAVKHFQQAHSLITDGKVGDATWAALQQFQPALWRRFLRQVPEFLQHTGLSYTDLTRLLDTHWVNPDPQASNAMVVHSPDDNCDLDRRVIQHQDGSHLGDGALQRMQCFIRLWRKLGWAMPDLDKAIVTLHADHFSPEFLQKLAQVARVQTALNLPLNQVLSFWADLDTDGTFSLYLKLFQNKAVLNPVDEAFNLVYAARLASLPHVTWPDSVKDKIAYDATAKELKFVGSMTSTEKQRLLDLSSQADYQNAIELLGQARWHDGIELALVTASSGDQSLSGHSPAILAGLRITDADLALIRAEANLAADEAPLNLANLTALYRHALLAKGLSLKVGDLLDLKTLSGLHPFRSPADTETFIGLAQKVQQSGFSMAQLDYVYRHLSPPAGNLAPDASGLLVLAKTLRDGLAQIAADNVLVDDPTGELTRSKLATLFESDVVDQTVNLINGSAVYVAPLSSLPAGIAFPSSVKNKVAYDSKGGMLQFTGGMTTNEQNDLLTTSPDADYQAAVNHLFQQPATFIQSTLSGFLGVQDASANLPDVTNAVNHLVRDMPSLDPNLQPVLLDKNGNVSTDSNLATTTAIANKFAYLLARLLPDVCDQLSHSLVKQTIGDALSLDSAMAELLLETPKIVPSRADAAKSASDDFLGLQAAGLSGSYFSSNDLGGAATTARIDAAVAFDGSASTPEATVPTGTGSARWTGMLLAPNNDDYTFYVHASGSVHLWAADDPAPLALTLESTTNEWVSQPLTLKASQLYDLRLEVTQLGSPAIVELRWSGAGTPRDLIPSTNLYPSTVFDIFTAAFTLLDKVATLVNDLALSADEVSYLAAQAADFAGLRFSALPLDRSDPARTDQQAIALFAWWQRLNDYVTLRNSLPQGRATLIDVFAATSLEDRLPVLQLGSTGAAVVGLQRLLNDLGVQPALNITAAYDSQTQDAMVSFQSSHGLNADGIVGADTWQALKSAAAPHRWQVRMEKAGKEDELIAATGWDALTLTTLTGEDGLNLAAADFTTEIKLTCLQACMQLLDRLGVSGNSLFRWAADAPDTQQAQDIVKSVKAKYDDATWLVVGKSLNDGLREIQRNALLAYILADPKIAAEGISDSNQLFEYFLIDVNMNACMLTSRISQAVSSVQLFIQRCLMNLEQLVEPSVIDPDQWEWMKNYSVWAANREVFLYPENWIEPDLRDDKTPFFEDLENQLLQNNVTTDTAEQAFLDYLEKLDAVARLEICGMYSQYEDLPDGISDVLHVVGHTHDTPPTYYYRQLINNSQWTPWEQVNLDIQSGHVIPIVYNRRVHLFWATFEEKSDDRQDLGAPFIEAKEHWQWKKNHARWQKTDQVWKELDAFYGSLQALDQNLGLNDTNAKKFVNGYNDPPQGADPWRREHDLLPIFDPNNEPKEPTEPQTSSQPSLTHWEIKLSWSEYWQNKWTPKQTTSQFVTSPNVTKTLGNVLEDAFPSDPNLQDIFLAYFANPKDNEFPYLDNPTPYIGDPPKNAVAALYLPGPDSHFFRTREDSGELVLELYRRYKHKFDTPYDFVDSAKPWGDPYNAIVLLTKALGRMDQAKTVSSYDKVGEFRLGGCGEQVRATSDYQDHYGSYDSLDMPAGTDNSYQTFTYDRSVDGTLTFTKHKKSLEVLQDIQKGSAHYDLLYEHKFSDFALTAPFQRFFYQGRKRIYFVDPKLVSPIELLTNAARVAPAFDTAPDDPLVSQFKTLPAGDSMTRLNAGAIALPSTIDTGPASPSRASRLAAAAQPLSQIQSADGNATMGLVNQYWDATIGTGKSGPAGLSYLQFMNFFHPHVCEFIRRLNRDGIPGLLKLGTQQFDNDTLHKGHAVTILETQYDPGPIVYPDYPREDVDFADGAYSLYNWELFFHVPMLIATQLSGNQQFEDAQTWFHFIFNPMTNSKEPAPQRYWKVLPFFNNSDPAKDQIQNLLTALASTSTDPATAAMREQVEAQIDTWRNDPFNPHLIARMRITAYQKNVVFKYISNLIAWGDSLFSQNTTESINQAALLYVLADDILGPRPEVLPAREAIQPKTYAQLKPNLDAFSNALVGLENEGVSKLSGLTLYAGYPALSLISTRQRRAPGAAPGAMQSLKSIAGALYFCIPPNTDMRQYWDTVADRLYKIRNCMNIEGVVQQLPLFEPPINPALLVRAAALGLDLSSVLSDINAPLPNYRFTYMLQKALELASELKSFGGALLAALEKKDAEALALLRATQETAVLRAVRDVRQLQIDEANAGLEALQKTRDVTQERYQFYNQIAFMNAEETAHIALATAAGGLQAAGQALEISAAGAYVAPNEFLGAAGWSSPVEITEIGGTNFGSELHAFGQAMGAVATYTSMLATVTATMGSYQRRWDEWQLQARLASKELVQIDKQIAAGQIRVAIAEKELGNQDKQIDNAAAIEDYLRNKYTNQDLYTWMTSQLSAVFFQCYNMAYDVAKRAEKAYRFERGLTSSSYVQFGDWDNLHKGLLSGERLYQDLKRLELAYLDQNKREYEITKHVSLMLTDPLALITLKETGSCQVELPEALFDADYPGHYLRRCKSVSLTIPCVVGPYTSINCTLTLLSNKTRISSTVGAGYAEDVENGDNRFVANFAAMQSIATSQAQNDSGMFELNFHDERYLPFEGAGAISRWRIDLPTETNAFDFNTLTDVVVHLKFTAREGGAILRSAAKKALSGVLAQQDEAPLARLFSLKHEFPTDWYRFLHPTDLSATVQALTIDLSYERFPFQFRGKTIEFSQVELFLNFKASTNHLDYTNDYRTHGSPLTVSLADASTTVNGALNGDPSILNGMPRAILSLSDKLPVSVTLSVAEDDVRNLASSLQHMVGSGVSAQHRLSADAIDDILVVCHYSVRDS